jgi:hypothetical protein
MNRGFYCITICMIVFWAVGFFVYHAGWMIHLMLIVAVSAIILKLTEKKKLRHTPHNNPFIS